MESLTIERSIYRLSSALAYRLTSRAALPLAVELEDLVLIESCRSLGITEKEMWIMSPGMFQSNDAIIEAYHCILEGFLFQLQLPMGEEPNTNEWWLRANMRGGGGGGVSISFDPTSSNFGGSRSVLRSSYMSSHEFFSHFRPKNSDWKGLAARHDLLRRYKVVIAQPASTPRPSSSSSSTSLPITDGDETMEAAPQHINNTTDQIIPSSSSSSSTTTTSTTTTLATPTIITKLVYDFPSARVPSTVDDLLRIGGCSASQVEGLMTFITSASAGSSSSSFSTTLGGGGGGGVSSESLPVMLDNTLTVLKEVKEFNIKTSKVIEAVRSLRGSSTSAENQLIKSMQLRRPLPSINDVFVSLSAKYQGGGGGGVGVGGINSASQLSEFSRGGRGRGRGGRGRGGGARGGGIIAPGRKRGRPPSSSSTVSATGKRGGLSSSFSHSLVTSTSDKVKPSIIRFQSSALSQSSLSQSALSQSALSQSALSQTRNEESGFSSVAVLSSTSFAGETGSSSGGGGRGGGGGGGGGGDDEVMNSAMNSGLSAGAASVVRTDGRGNDMELIEALFEETS
jgi:hypothetical protein